MKTLDSIARHSARSLIAAFSVALMVFSSALPPMEAQEDAAAPAVRPGEDSDAENSSAIKEKKEREEKRKKEKSKGKVRGDAPCLAWIEPRVPSRAVLLCVHGLGLYSGSWEQFGKRMSALGYPTYAIDVRGFGSWMKAKGHQKVNFNACLEDVQATLRAVRTANPGLPVILMGESMGGAIALQSTAFYPSLVDGLISSVPAAQRFQQKRTDLKVALHMLAGPNRPFDVGTGVIEQATQNPDLRQEWKDDPLDRLKLSPKELLQFQSFMNKNHDRAGDIKTTPVLIVQGSADKLVKPEGTVELFNELATADKELVMVPNQEHLIFEEGQFNDETLDVVVGWINRHFPETRQATADPAASLVAQAKQKMAQQQFGDAITILTQAVSASPDSAEANFLLGVCYLKTQRFLKAREHLRKAMRLSHGTAHGRKANQMLMAIPPALLVGRTGPGTRAFAGGLRRFPGAPRFAAAHPAAMTGPGGAGGARRGRRGRSRRQAPAATPTGETAGQPAVLVFNATWCEPCKDMDEVIEQGKQRFGDRVSFVTIDVDDPANHELVEQYSISPVPTVVFLKSNGEVAGYQIGYAGIDGMVKGMTKILRD